MKEFLNQIASIENLEDNGAFFDELVKKSNIIHVEIV